MTEFLDLSLLDTTLQATKEWRSHFSDLGFFASGIAFHHDPTAFGGEGADLATIVANGVEVEAAEFAANDIRFSAVFPDGHSIYGGETFFAETDGRRGLFGAMRMPEAAVEAHSALNALLVIATMKAIADAATHKTWDEIQRAGGIETPTGRLSPLDLD
ncbi:hypothetical protein ACFY5D_22045 [Paeniglutamicibacter sp. NPDC012692]|uniref:hypothetical protein n=1 Tax=Paeniglutamicibacter sp. NPDC012692 TaxID=3364388 RepID=UPI0036BFA821